MGDVAVGLDASGSPLEPEQAANANRQAQASIEGIGIMIFMSLLSPFAGLLAHESVTVM